MPNGTRLTFRIVGGENIAPSDIETLLVKHNSIAAAAVVGVQDPMWGEAICAFVEQDSDISRGGITDREVKSWLRKQGLEPHKMPKYFPRLNGQNGLPSAIPVNSTGKSLKGELRDLANQKILENRM